MRFLKRLATVVGVAIAVLFTPSLLLKICSLPLPRLCLILNAIALILIPLEVGIVGIYFCVGMVLLLLKGLRERSFGQMLTATLMFPLGCLLTGYVLELAVKAMWLRR